MSITIDDIVDTVLSYRAKLQEIADANRKLAEQAQKANARAQALEDANHEAKTGGPGEIEPSGGTVLRNAKKLIDRA